MYGSPSAPESWGEPLPKVPFGIEPLQPAPLPDAVRKYIDAATVKVDPPPPEADAEAKAIAVLSALDDEARTRVLRYANSRWSPASRELSKP